MLGPHSTLRPPPLPQQSLEDITNYQPTRQDYLLASRECIGELAPGTPSQDPTGRHESNDPEQRENFGFHCGAAQQVHVRPLAGVSSLQCDDTVAAECRRLNEPLLLALNSVRTINRKIRGFGKSPSREVVIFRALALPKRSGPSNNLERIRVACMVIVNDGDGMKPRTTQCSLKCDLLHE